MRLIKIYFNVLFALFALVLLSGCLNVNIKSALPNQTYYNLDNIKLSSTKCNNKKNASDFGLNISVLSPFDGKDILLYGDNQEIKILENYKWIDLPKNMIRNAFVKVGINNCMQITQNPPISQRINTIKISVNEMYLKSNKNEHEAYIYLVYEILGYDMKRLQYGVIQTNASNINPAIALQNAVNEAIEKVIKEL